MIAEMLTCIALNVYYEARSEPLESQVGVAHVVLNRVASDKFPDDACSVIYQGLEKYLLHAVHYKPLHISTKVHHRLVQN